ncbi:MAG: glutamine-hydrolyzing GMP synthase [Betaproteobacteria bacterium AqS2]|uniref:GMP synthase [glutamine-hydrolyzing] n=1 Tax=Candidatus Amphirhobacter heronislandensis TaxID=1732024 RepID=A0A930XYC0_9GAMM|nr:glutamine-hydrolyzing GMP synthase [Betaproteobacteria bacterium AqS2]
MAGEAAAPAAGICVVDFGSQYTLLIARRLRELGVYSEVVGCAGDVAGALAGRAGVILSGGPASALAPGAPGLPPAVLASGLPVLGICYGMQLLARELGGELEACDSAGGYGRAEIEVAAAGGGLLDGLAAAGAKLAVWTSHGDRVARLPDGFAATAAGPSAPVMAMADPKRRLHGLQFHPEVAHTEQGMRMLERFAAEVCGADRGWTPARVAEQAAAAVRAQVGEQERVLLGLSGGVDSAVAAALLERALPGRLVCVLVDNGLLRENEAAEVKEAFADLGERLVVVDAAAEFMAALAGLDEPEAKRRAIGRTFIEVFEAEAARLGGIRFLAQGTIYPDVVESAGDGAGAAAKIKSHHNVGGLPARLGMELVEPLRLLFKDEVRRLGAELGLPAALLERHPFPGPGLAVRVPGEVTAARLETARRADSIFIAELRAAGWHQKVAQAFAVALPVDTVGVQGDGRTYAAAVALRAVVTDDFMTAAAAELPQELLARTATRICNEVPGVNRVLYDVTSKPPATVEWE